jgi:hypothetical protein
MMKTSPYTKAAPSVRDAVPQELVDWLRSDSGRSAVETAVSNSLTTVERLNEARKVQPEQLNVPITL